MQPVAILGTGMAALGARHALVEAGVPHLCFDKANYVGGHTATFVDPSGFVFDDGPHVSFTKDEEIMELLAATVGGEYETVPSHINNYWHGRWITHPVQMNLHGLPPDLVTKVLVDFIAIKDEAEPEIHNYAEWLVASYGRTFAETFPMVYGRKYHTTDTANLTTEWLGPRMYRPSLEEMIRGALAAPEKNVHYVTGFRYPTRGGFASYLRPMREDPAVRLDHRLVALDAHKKELFFANGARFEFDALVSSIPLPDLIPLVVDAPAEVLEAAGRLSFTTAVMVNIGVDRADLSEAHVSYFYDEDIIFPRATFPHLMSPYNTPPGMSSIQVELYYSDRYRPLDRSPESLIDPVIADLTKTGLLRETDRIVFREARVARYANVIYDHDRAAAVDVVHGFLDDIGVHYCGRYGNWNHEWTDEAFRSGERAARASLGVAAA